MWNQPYNNIGIDNNKQWAYIQVCWFLLYFILFFCVLHFFSFFLYSYLLPHLLPPKPAMDIHGFRQHTKNTLQRIFKMSFVPAGFWERFIARMLISLTEMDLQVLNQLTLPQILIIHRLNLHTSFFFIHGLQCFIYAGIWIQKKHQQP